MGVLKCFPHQIFEECRDLSGEHSQVEEPSGDFIVVLGQVAVPQVLQNLDVLLLVFHMGLKSKTQAHKISAGWQSRVI